MVERSQNGHREGISDSEEQRGSQEEVRGHREKTQGSQRGDSACPSARQDSEQSLL